MTLAFTINGPPQAWQRTGTRAGAFYTPAETRAYEALVAQVAMLSARAQRWTLTCEPVAVVLRVFFPNRRRRDLDNVSKSLLDGITKARAVWADDSQVSDLRILRGYDADRPRVEVAIEVMG